MDMEKEDFLKRLETALKKLVCDRLHADADDRTRGKLESEVSEFISQNSSQYTFEELQETFVSAEIAIGLFLEYQDAKRLVPED